MLIYRNFIRSGCSQQREQLPGVFGDSFRAPQGVRVIYLPISPVFSVKKQWTNHILEIMQSRFGKQIEFLI